jgi:hypothetical protein
MIFLFGVLFGVLVVISRSFNREDRRKSLKGTPPDAACGGARWLVGVSRRDHQPGQQPGQYPRGPSEVPGQGQGQEW